ncbi:MAG: SAM-dependent methyltransferase [Ferruginibacter sp.]
MSTVYLIPTVLAPGSLETIPSYVMLAVKKCKVIFAENERTARRFLKAMDKEIVIDNFEWYGIDKHDAEQEIIFSKKLKESVDIAIISEAGCPGIADPGQELVAIAHKMGAIVKPLVGPSSILLSLMASGMNGQQFEFVGYLPIDNQQRTQRILELQGASNKSNSTKIFIETPYRNNQLLETLLKVCDKQTLLCIASNISDATEKIITLTIAEWRNKKPELHKQPVIFLLYAGT